MVFTVEPCRRAFLIFLMEEKKFQLLELPTNFTWNGTMAKIDDDQRSKLIFLVCRLLATTTCKNGRHKKHLVGERQLASNIF